MNILFLFNQGSEIRQFIYSGVINDLSKNNKIFLSLRVKNEEIKKNILLNDSISIVDFYRKKMPFNFVFLNRIINSTKLNKKQWKYKDEELKFKSKSKKYLYNILFFTLKNLSKINLIYKHIENYLINFDNKFINSEWIELLKKNKVDKVIVNVPNVNYDLLFSCKKLNIPVKLLFHTNKDIFTLGKIFYPYSAIGVWNDKMKEDFLLNNKSFESKKIEIIGCSHFSYLLDNKNYRISENYKFNIDKSKINILYIAAAPFVVKNEMENIKLINECLNELNIKNYRIIVKTNPMDDTNYWNSLYIENHVKIYKSQWRWNKEEGFNFPYQSELYNFNNLLENSKVVIGLPSTVTLEAAIKGIPNINICATFGKCTTIYKDISEMWFAPFYKNVLRYSASIGVFNKEEMIKSLKKILIENNKLNYDNYLTSELSVELKKLSDLSLKLIRK